VFVRVTCHPDASQQSLEADQLDAEAKLAKVKKAKDAAAAAFASMKASGLGGVELNREMYMKLEEEIAETRTQLKVLSDCLRQPTCVEIAEVFVFVCLCVSLTAACR
jgi:hypothetical protein